MQTRCCFATSVADCQVPTMWADTAVLSGDLATAIGELKGGQAGELQVHGSGELVRWLLDNQLIDEIILLTYPVCVGQGTRLFPDNGPDTALARGMRGPVQREVLIGTELCRDPAADSAACARGQQGLAFVRPVHDAVYAATRTDLT